MHPTQPVSWPLAARVHLYICRPRELRLVPNQQHSLVWWEPTHENYWGCGLKMATVLNPKTPASPEETLNNQLPVFTSLSLQELQKALSPDLQDWGIRVICVNAECQGSKSSRSTGRGNKVHFAIPFILSVFQKFVIKLCQFQAFLGNVLCSRIPDPYCKEFMSPGQQIF